MICVRQILKQKANQDVCTIAPDRTVYEAVKMFAELELGSLLVTDGERLLGIITERDYARKITLQGRSSRLTRVAEIMSRDVITVTPDTSVDGCMGLMISNYIRHLPVVEHGRIVGVVSIGDVVKAALREREFIIGELTRYITDSPLTEQAFAHSMGRHLEAG